MAEAPRTDGGDIAALAKGGRTNFLGFLLRLAARLPFLFIAGRLYGAEALGRFASALLVVELAAMICSMGEKRGLAQRLAEAPDTAAARPLPQGQHIARLQRLTARSQRAGFMAGIPAGSPCRAGW